MFKRCLIAADQASVFMAMTSDHNRLELRIQDYSNEQSSSKLVPKVDSYKNGDGDASFQLKSDSLPHAHAQTTKTFYKHQDSRIMKAQELNDKVFRTNSDIQDLPSKISSLSREITKSKDNDKGSRSKITKHEGTSLQRIQRPRPQDLNNNSNLIDLTRECHNELTSGEIVSLKILSRTMEVRS
ncbi:hypothetical protein Tco_1216875 [Tanacetum coccineum]